MRTKNKKQQDKSIFYHLGNLFLITAALMAFLVYYPVISIYLFPPKIQPEQNLKGDYITIPKINAQAPIFFNVDPYHENIYQPILKRGVAQAKGTALPGEKGSMFVFAHSSGNPFEITRYNTIFLRLGDLGNNDIVEIKKDGKVYKYKVTDKKIVSPTDVKYLKEKKDQLIVQTCWPIGTSLKRLLIFAVPLN
ncbi:MAG: sortase [Patescibacteria group bacterium]